MHARRTIRVCSLILAIGLTTAGVSVAEEQEKPLSLGEQLHKSMQGIQANVQNASVKLRGGMAGVESAPAPGARRPTPAENCCGSNVERINQRVNEMVRTLEEMDIYYADRANAGALERLNTIRGELSIVTRGVAVFKMAGTIETADQALAGIIRPFNRLRDAIEELEQCCPTEKPHAPEGRAADRKK